MLLNKVLKFIIFLSYQFIDFISLNFAISANNSHHKNSIRAIATVLQSLTMSTPLQYSQAEQQTGIQYSYILSFNHEMSKHVIDQLFVHLMRMLCLLACVIDETALPTNLTQNLAAGFTGVAVNEKFFSNTTQSPNSSIEQNSPNISKKNLNESNNKKGMNLTTKLENSTKVRNTSQSSGNSNQVFHLIKYDIIKTKVNKNLICVLR